MYPRIDPAVIVAVIFNDDWILLGRKQSWPTGRYSLLAGFVEVGETLEAAVEREVMDESGVSIDPVTVRYHSSQAWPFPQSLMVGFWAEARIDDSSRGVPVKGAALEALPRQAQRAAQEVGLLPSEAERYAPSTLPQVTIDTDELEDARWFHRAWITRALGGAEGSSRESIFRHEQREDDTFNGFRIPGKYALANRIISDWLQSSSSSIRDSSLDTALWMDDDCVPDVIIDSGSFKYVLLRVVSGDGARSKLIIRGDARAEYHNHIFSAAKSEIAAVDPMLRVETVGGGRMEHHPEHRAISVFGYSAAFNQAPHDITAEILRRKMPLCEVIVGYDGY